MDYSNITKQKEPVRLFKSNFLESFSHISPKLVAIIFIPVILLSLIWSIRDFIITESSWFFFPLALVGGWFIWTFVEYFMHRFIFHYHPKTEKLKKIFFTFHGVHHHQPMCKTRLVMPPAISLPLGVVFYLIFRLLCITLLNRPEMLYVAYAGFGIGYFAYDMIHYTLHHAKIKDGYLAMCRRQHMRHHFNCPNMRFGVSIPIWDYLFGTMPKSGLRKNLAKHSDTPRNKQNDDSNNNDSIPVR